MYAVVRVNTMDRERVAEARDRLAEFAEVHAMQPGFVGTLTVRVDEDREVVGNLWESEERTRAGLEVMGPLAGRLLAPLMAAPSQLVAAGAATATGAVGDALAAVLTRKDADVAP